LENNRKSTRTYDSLGSEIVFLTVMLEIIEDLGTRHYMIFVLAEREIKGSRDYLRIVYTEKSM
jgi:hypothetical protein